MLDKKRISCVFALTKTNLFLWWTDSFGEIKIFLSVHRSWYLQMKISFWWNLICSQKPGQTAKKRLTITIKNVVNIFARFVGRNRNFWRNESKIKAATIVHNFPSTNNKMYSKSSGNWSVFLAMRRSMQTILCCCHQQMACPLVRGRRGVRRRMIK